MKTQLFGVGPDQLTDRQIRSMMGEAVSRQLAGGGVDGVEAAIQRGDHSATRMLMTTALSVRDRLPFLDGRGPDDKQWQQMARVAVEERVLNQRRWGNLTGGGVVEQLKETTAEAIRSLPQGQGLLLSDMPQAEAAARRAFDQAKAGIEMQLRQQSAEPPDPYQWFVIRSRAVDGYFLHARLFEAWNLHPGAKNMTVLPGQPPIWELDNGQRLRGNLPVADTAEDLRRIVKRLASPAGIEAKVWDQNHHELELGLPDGSRLTAVIDPIIPNGPFVTVRRHLRPRITLDEYRADNPGELIELLRAMMKARLSILIVGGTNSGKTTLLRALGSCFEPLESIVVAESVQELRYEEHPDMYGHGIYPLLAQPPGPHGGGVTLGECVITAQRMSPDRIVVGEIRGPEVEGLVTAAKMGHPILSTIHGHDAADGVMNLARSHEQYSNARFDNSLSQLCSVLDAVVTIATHDRRFVVEGVGMVNGLAANRPIPEIDVVFGPVGEPGSFGFRHQTSANLHPHYRDRLRRVGIDRILAAGAAAGSGAGSNGAGR